MRQFLRLNLLIFSLSLILLGLMLRLGDGLEGHGSLIFEAGVGSNVYEIFVDYDSQMLLMRGTSFAGRSPISFVDEENRLFYTDSFGRQRLDLGREIIPAYSHWNRQENAILLAYRNTDNAVIAWLNPESLELRQIALYENFLLGFAEMSPDGRYIMLREAGLVRPIPQPKPMLLVDLWTGETRDFGSPVFAYWSPNSQYLALGYKEGEERYESRVERYEIATGERLPYPVLASQEDTPFFYTNGFSSTGVLWSPDSSKMVVLNRDTESINFISGVGSVLEVSGGRITPLRWSPDSRFLLGIGYANREVGAFVVDSQTGEVNRLQSPVLLQDALSDFAWSPDSRYVAVLTHSSGVVFEQRLILYDTAGRMIGSPVDLDLTMIFASTDGTLRWVN